MWWVSVEGCSLTAYASSAPRCAATAGIVTLCACQAVMPNRSVLRAMRPESPAVISISHSLPTGFGRASAASSDLRRGDKIGTLQNFVFCLLGLGRSRPPQRENAIWNFRLMSCSWAGLATNAAGMLIHSALVCAFVYASESHPDVSAAALAWTMSSAQEAPPAESTAPLVGGATGIGLTQMLRCDCSRL